jgi:hypothetical protein
MLDKEWKDLELLKAGARDSAFILVEEPLAREFILSIHKMGLHPSVISTVKWGKEPGGTFSFSGLTNPEPGPVSLHYNIYVCRRAADAKAAGKLATMGGDWDDPAYTRLNGSLLGYPPCCVEFFIGTFAKHVSFSSVIDAYVGSYRALPRPMVMNVFARIFGDSFLSHYPCSMECEDSRNMGLRYHEALKTHNPRMALRIERLSRCKVAVCPGTGMWGFRDEQSSRLGRPALVMNSHSFTKDIGWMFEKRLFIEQVPGGIVLTGRDGLKKSLECPVFDFTTAGPGFSR